MSWAPITTWAGVTVPVPLWPAWAFAVITRGKACTGWREAELIVQCHPNYDFHSVHRARGDLGSGSSPEGRRRGRLRIALAQSNPEIQPRRFPVLDYPRAERGSRPGHTLGQE